MSRLDRTSVFCFGCLRLYKARSSWPILIGSGTLKIKRRSGCAGYGTFPIGLVLLIPLLTLSALGQNNGVPTFATVEDHGIDAIDLQNLDVLISPPVRNKTGAIPFHFALTGISNCTIIPQTDAGGNTYNYMACGTSPQKKWSQYSPSIITEDSGLLTASAKHTVSTSATCPNGTATTKYSSWIIQDSRFGTTHALPTADYVDSAQCLKASFTDQASDNSGYTLAVTSGGSADTIYTSSGLSVSTSSNVTTVTDTNGNTESLNSVAPEVITDTLGTTALTFLISTGSSTNGNYSWKDINGNTQTISQTYGTLNIDNAFGCGAKLVNWIGATVTSGITYPDGNIAFTKQMATQVTIPAVFIRLRTKPEEPLPIPTLAVVMDLTARISFLPRCPA